MQKTMGQPERRQQITVTGGYVVNLTQVSDTVSNISRMVWYDGRMWKSGTALCRAYGILYGSVSDRMRICGEDFLEAFRHLLSIGKGEAPSDTAIERNTCRKYRGEYYSSASSAAEAYGVHSSHISYMLRTGASFESAMDYLVGRTYSTGTAA